MDIIAVLDFNCNSVDIIKVEPEIMSNYEDVEEFLSEYCQYNLSNIEYMYGDDSEITLNLNMTPESFG